MTATTKSRLRVNLGPRRFGWAGAAVIAAFAPKCVGCLAAYLGVGAALGLTGAGVELCGGRAGAPVGAIAWLAGVAAVSAMVVYRRARRRHGGEPMAG